MIHKNIKKSHYNLQTPQKSLRIINSPKNLGKILEKLKKPQQSPDSL